MAQNTRSLMQVRSEGKTQMIALPHLWYQGRTLSMHQQRREIPETAGCDPEDGLGVAFGEPHVGFGEDAGFVDTQTSWPRTIENVWSFE